MINIVPHRLCSRLYLPMVAAIALPIGLFWFAWTSDPPVHYIVPILSGLPTGMGIAQIMIGLVQYLIDTYTIYCASAIASTVLLRSILGAAFPLISPPMYKKLGNHWAISIFAFISLACTPIPWLFYVRTAPIALLMHHLIRGYLHRNTDHGSVADHSLQSIASPLLPLFPRIITTPHVRRK